LHAGAQFFRGLNTGITSRFYHGISSLGSAETHPLVEGLFEKSIRDQHLLDIIHRIEAKTAQKSRT
jgi:hypothetical protein